MTPTAEIVRRLLDNDSIVIQGLFHCVPTMKEAAARLEELQVEADRLREDAARYRWLREQFCPPLTATHPVVIGGWALTRTAEGFVPTQRKLYENAEQVDAAIDAARSAPADGGSAAIDSTAKRTDGDPKP